MFETVMKKSKKLVNIFWFRLTALKLLVRRVEIAIAIIIWTKILAGDFYPYSGTNNTALSLHIVSKLFLIEFKCKEIEVRYLYLKHHTLNI